MSRRLVVAIALGALAVVGCKQVIGDDFTVDDDGSGPGGPGTANSACDTELQTCVACVEGCANGANASETTVPDACKVCSAYSPGSYCCQGITAEDLASFETVCHCTSCAGIEGTILTQCNGIPGGSVSGGS